MKMLRYLVLIIVWMLLTPTRLMAQDDAEYRMEIGGGLGTSFYIGDVNTKFYHNTGIGAGAVWRYMFDHRNALKTALTYGKIKGQSDISIDYYPQDLKSGAASEDMLNYEFSSSVVDLSCMYEVNFWPLGYYQNYKGDKRITPFLQLGFGMTYAGQDKSMTANLPLGAGIKYKISKRWNATLDWTIHFSFSDKLDGLDAPLGIKGAGIKNKDSYQLTMLTLSYNFSAICPNCNKY